MNKRFLFLLFLTLSGVVFGQTTIYVNSVTGNDSSGNGSSALPYKTFYEGYTKASSRDTLNLSGTFTWTDTDEIGDVIGEGFIISENLTIIGDNPTTTIIQAATTSNTADRRVFKINDGYQVTFKNLTIRNGVSFAGWDYPPYRHDLNYTTPIMTSGTGSYIYQLGGAIGSDQGSSRSVSMTLENVIISENYSNGTSTAGVYSEGDISITNSTFQNNISFNQTGSGIALTLYTPVVDKMRNVINSTFYNNINTGGGSNAAAIYVDRVGANIVNCTVINNTNGIKTYAMDQNDDEVHIVNTVVLGSIEYDIYDYNRYNYTNGVRFYNSIIGTLYTDYAPSFYFSNTTTGTSLVNAGVVTPTTNDGNNSNTPYLKINSSSFLKDYGLNGTVGSSYSGGTLSVPSTDQSGNLRNDGSIDVGSFENQYISQNISNFSISDNEINNNDNAQLSISLTQSSTTFLSEDIQIESSSSNTGSIQNFTATDSKTYTAYFIPPSNESGTVTLTIPAESFEDDQSRSNTTTATLALTFDTISPTISSFAHDHDDLVVNGEDTVVFTITFSEDMTATPTINIESISENDIENALMTATSSNIWTYSWNVPAGKNGAFSATVSGTDLFGNYYAGTDSVTFTVDNTDPTITLVENDVDDTLIIGETVLLTASADETIAGTPTLTITVQGSPTDYSMTSSGASWTYSYSPPSNFSGTVTYTVEMIDVAGNAASTTLALSVDTIAPTIQQISSPMANGTYTDNDSNQALSDTVTITVTFTESVTVSGTPRVVLNTTPVSYADFSDGSGTTTLTFTNPVAQEVQTLDLNVTALDLNGGTIVDGASNTASLSLADINSNYMNLSDLKTIKLDAKNPTLSSFTVSDTNNLAPVVSYSVNDGDVATYSFTSDKQLLLSSLTVTFTGFTPTLRTLEVGSGPYTYNLSFTVSSSFPEGDVLFQASATDKVTSTLVNVANPTGTFNQSYFNDLIVIDRTAPSITSNANLTSNENSTAGPTITASEAVIYSIIGGADQALLSINQTSGALTFSSAPDYENPTDGGADNTYEIVVKAIDRVGLTVTQTVNIQINDLNDTFGVEVTQTDIQTTETGETATIGFILITQPTANVTIGLSLSDATEGTLNTTQLTFSPNNWNVGQTITINGVDDGVADGDVAYQLISANTVSEDANYNNLVVDNVTLTNIDNEIDSDGDGFFDYQDAFPGDPLEWLDTDGDGVGNNTDLDDDEDGISDVYENQLGTDPLDPNDTPSDFNANGIPDALEDSDGDGYNDDIDLYPLDPTRALDNDGDGIADNEDFDDDNDGIPDTEDAFPLDSRYSKDTDNDGDPNLTDPDDDGDGFDDENDAFPLDGTEHVDTDGDGIGNNADLDDDGDGVADLAEDEFISITQSYRILINNNLKKDVSSDTLYYPLQRPSKRSVGKWKIRKRVSGGNDKDQFTIRSGEPAAGLNKSEQKNNGSEGYLAFIIPPDINNPRDHNKDNVYEVEVSYINTTGGDTNVPVPQAQETIAVAPLTVDVMELLTEPTPREATSQYEVVADLDADKIQNSLDPDDDGDGIFTLFEPPKQDTDLDEYPDFQDPDDDNDGVFTRFENPDLNGDFNPQDGQDSNADGIKDYLDHDDDGDHILTINEFADPNNDGNPIDAQDFDSDGTPDYLDPDDDNDGMLSQNEINMGSPLLLKDTDRDGNPDYRDTDDDNDGVPTLYELDAVGNPLDTDGDGTIDPLDSDDDGDGLLTLTEDPNGNGSPTDDDTDNDGVPNYLESNILDRDDDGVVDEKDTVDNDPYNDQDGDGFPNLDETLAGTNPLDANSYPNGFFGALRASIDIVRFFSPNGDGINDTWQVKEIDRYSNNQIWIYTRSGTLLFNTKYYRNDWAGTHNGNPLPEGSYYYRIDLDGNGSVDFEGWLYLTR